MHIGKKELKFQKPTKKQVLAFLRYAFIVVAGNAIIAVATAFFIEPNDFVMGGTTGLGILIKHLLEQSGKTGAIVEWAVTITVYVANFALFLIGAFFLGKKFALATLAGTVLYPSFIALFQLLNKLYLEANGGLAMAHDQPLVAAIIGSLLFGLGIGMEVRVGASTGGTDIPPLIMHKLFNFPVALGIWVLDLAIVALQLLAADLTAVLIGVIITLLSSWIIDMVALIGTKRLQVKIISKKNREIREMILHKLNRGATLLYGKTGYLQEKCFVLLTVVTNRDIVKLKNEIHAIDPDAFLMISIISEVRGRGFSSERIQLPKDACVSEDLEEVDFGLLERDKSESDEK